MIKEIASWIFGFLTIPIVIGIIVSAFGWFHIPEWLGLSTDNAVMGGFLFIALVILAGIALSRFGF